MKIKQKLKDKLMRLTVRFKQLSMVGIFITLLLILFTSGLTQISGQITWPQAMSQKEGWYGTDEAVRIADNVLLYQNNNGGWSKNIDMSKMLTDSEIQRLIIEKSDTNGTTIDNNATHTQMRYLARVYKATGHSRFKTGFLKGVDYLLEAQYENGGWPQFYPLRSGYYDHITLNDGAMIKVMTILKEIGEGKQQFSFVDEIRKEKASNAVRIGIDLILKMQIQVEGKLTAWCAQHDKDDLSPAKARAYELPSISGGESVGVVEFLMGLDNPSPEIVQSVKSAVDWLERSKIEGKRVIRRPNPDLPRGYDVIVVDDPDAGSLWGRFYEIETNRPIFVGRDGIIRYNLDEIEHERRVGYVYLRNFAEELISIDYPKWLKNWNLED
jgi:PelA/Pel-15E family pectate lyase